MEREKLICCLVGKFTALEPSINPQDLRIKIDQHLHNCNLTPLGCESNDTELIQELYDEALISVIGSGKNRKARRGVKN